MTIECQPEAEQCQVNLLEQQPDCSMYEITVPPEAVETRLIMVQPTAEDEPVRVPVRIPVRRLRWALAGGQSQVTPLHLERTGWMIKQSLDALEQSQSPVLFVDYGQGVQTISFKAESPEPESLSLSLVDLDNQELMHLPVTKPRQSQGRSVWRFELAPFLDTIRHSSSPVVRLELEYLHTDGTVRLPVLSLTRSMIVDKVDLEISLPVEGHLKIKLTWQENVRLRHRRVRFWPLWRPWLPYYEQSIPDEAAGELEFEIPVTHLITHLPLGAYQLEFLVVDPWVGTAAAEQPPLGSAGTAVVEMISASRRLEQIERTLETSQPQNKPKSSILSRLFGGIAGTKELKETEGTPSVDLIENPFELILEKVHIQAWLGDDAKIETELETCYNRLDEATIPQILALTSLVQQRGDQRLLTALRLKMFSPHFLRHLLDEQTSGEITPDQYQTYFTHLPRSGLLPLSTCEKLLTVDDEKIQLYAILQLIRRNESLGVLAVVGLVKSKALSYGDATEILKLNLELAMEYLEDHLDDPVAVGLIEKISPDRSAIVRVGHWVRSQAGWGQLTCILNIDDDQPLDHFTKGQSNLRLHVTLRPQHDAEKVVIEVLNDCHRVYFKHAEKLYRCTKWNDCDFITKDQNLLVSEHNRVAHGGLRPQFAIEHKLQFISVKTLEYSVRAPRNMLS